MQIDPVSGTITTVSPTSLVYGGGVVTPPTDVQVFLPVANGSLEVQAPSGGGYAGTLYTVEGISRTKTVTVREWRDYSLNTNMQTYANELFDSIKDVIVEGTIGYLGLATTYLAPGQAVSITGNGYTTGYESAGPARGLDRHPVQCGPRGDVLRQHAAPLEPQGPLHRRHLRASRRHRPAARPGLVAGLHHTARRDARMNGTLNRLEQLEARFERLRLDLQDTQRKLTQALQQIRDGQARYVPTGGGGANAIFWAHAPSAIAAATGSWPTLIPARSRRDIYVDLAGTLTLVAIVADGALVLQGQRGQRLADSRRAHR